MSGPSRMGPERGPALPALTISSGISRGIPPGVLDIGRGHVLCPASRCARPQARAAHRHLTPLGSPASELVGRGVNDSLTNPRTGSGGTRATRLLVAVGALHAFVPLLCFDRQGRNRTRLQSTNPDRLIG